MDSNTNKAIGVFGQLPTWAKGVIAIALTGAALYGGYRIYKFVKKQADKAKGDEQVSDTKRELNDLNSKPETAQKLSKAEAESIANTLFTAMDGCLTDSTTIARALMNVRNKADWMAISKAWGVRDLTCMWGDTKNVTLDGALSSEIKSVHASLMNPIRDYLRKLGVKITW